MPRDWRRYKVVVVIVLLTFFIASFYVAAYGGIRGTLLKFKAPDFSTLEARIDEFGLDVSDNLRAAPNGRIWAAASAAKGDQTDKEKVIQVSPRGQIKRLNVASANRWQSIGPTKDVDSVAWFAFPNSGGYEIVGADGRGAFRAFSLPVPLPEGSGGELILGPGDSLWFAKGGPGIGSVSSSGRLESVNPLPDDPNLTVSHLSKGAKGKVLAAGINGFGQPVILQIDQSSGVEIFRLSDTPSFGALNNLSGCKDGSAWFSMETEPPRIGHLNPEGELRSWAVPSPSSGWIDVGSLACASSGNLWFKEIWQTTVVGFFGQSIRDVGMIGRLSLTGKFDRIVVPSFGYFPLGGLASATDGAVWYTHRDGVGRLVISIK